MALLAASPKQRLTRDRLVGRLWPDAPAEQARKLLSEALYVIRRELGEGTLQTEGDVVALSTAEVSSDVLEFIDAIEAGNPADAIALYTGPFLDGWYLNDAPDLERWIDDQRARFGEAYARAVEDVIQRAEQSDRWADAALLWKRLGDVDPHRASYAIGLANALAMAGERPTALHCLAQYSARLRVELEVEPDDDVRRLERRLRRDGRLSPSASSRGAVDVSAPNSAAVEPDNPILVTSVHIDGPSVRPRRRRWFAGLVLGAVAIGLAIAAARPSAKAPPDLNRLAVLYLRDASIEQDLGPTADVITEALIEQLAGVNAFEVVQAGAVKPFRTRNVDVDSVARALHAGSVVEGSVQRVDERLVVGIRLVNASNGSIAWSSHFEGRTSALLDLQQRIAHDVAVGIRQRLGVEVQLRQLTAGTTNERARQLLARGNRERDDAHELLLRTSTREDVIGAINRLKVADSLYFQAESEDTRWARPWVERGWASIALSPLEVGTAKWSQLIRAEAFGDTALKLAPGSPEALELRGTALWRQFRFQDGRNRDTTDVLRAIADLEDAVGRDSTLARAWATLSNIYWIRNNPRLSYLAGRRALRADTYLEDSPRILQNLISASLLRDTFDSTNRRAALDTAKAWCGRGRAQFPTNWHFTECELTIMKYDDYTRPDLPTALRLLARLDSLDPPAAAASAGHAYSPLYRRLVVAAVMARTGDLRSAKAVLAEQKRRAEELDRQTGPNVQLDLIPDAITLLLLFGDTASASALLDTAIAARPILQGVAANDRILFKAIQRKH